MLGQHSPRRILRAILLGASGYLALSITPFMALGPDACSANDEAGCSFSPGSSCLDGDRILDNYRPRYAGPETD